jgi:DNA repair exonuclease SbcCD nuclease subunit
MLVNSETALNNLTYIKQYCLENKIDTVIGAGDFFHTKSKAYAPHVIQARLRLKDWKKAGINHYMIIGNHDMSNQNNTLNSIVFVFSEYATIIPDYYFFDIENTRIHFMSYTKKIFPRFILSEEKKNVLISHLDIQGFTMSNGYQATTGFTVRDLSKFDLVITGHYHKHQVRNNIVYVGSSNQTSFSERDQKHGFLLFDTETLEWELIENNPAPKYKFLNVKEYSDIDEKDVDNNFLRIKLFSHRISTSKLRNYLFDRGALSVDIIPPEDIKEIGKYYNKTISDIPREIAAEYISSLKEVSLNKNNLLKYFDKIEDYVNNPNFEEE